MHSATDPPVWHKSGPPTHEFRMQRGEPVPPLLTRPPAVQVGKTIVELRRDINGLMGKKNKDININSLLQPEKTKPLHSELDDHELWEALGQPPGTSRSELNKKALRRLVERRCLDTTTRE